MSTAQTIPKVVKEYFLLNNKPDKGIDFSRKYNL